jgi:RNA polymerase-binding transcription factor DksA
MKKAKKVVKKAKPPTKVGGRKSKTTAKPKPSRLAKPAPTRTPTPTLAVETAEPPPPRTLKLSKEDAAKFKKLLLDLRDHLIDGVNFLASDNLKRSNKEASGELSGYSLHMADAGTDNFDREFALSLVSNEQEGLYEIEEALKRLEAGTYGVCEMCDKLIAKERLEAVPFARRCIQCQSAFEKDRRYVPRQGPMFTESAEDGDGDETDAED